MTDKQKTTEFPPPNPGESMDAYLHRVRVHPDTKNPVVATEADEEEVRKNTETYKDHGFVITKK
jgi:hypothetical protein